jgi:predicted DNA-binding transcriptional regulator AlpA
MARTSPPKRPIRSQAEREETSPALEASQGGFLQNEAGSSMTAREQLLSVVEKPERLLEIQLSDVPALVAELEGVRVRLWLRLIVGDPSNRSHDDGTPDRVLTPNEAAAMLGVTTRWLYRHRRRLPFALPLSRRALRFSQIGLQQWLKEGLKNSS